MTNTEAIKATNLKLSDKVNKIKSLPDIDNKAAVVQEIEALEVFTPDERAGIFGNDNIVWILKSYTIAQLKDKALTALVKVDVSVGDLVKFGRPESIGIVLSVDGTHQDRLSIMYRKYHEFGSTFEFIEGVSVYDVTVTDEKVNVDFLSKI